MYVTKILKQLYVVINVIDRSNPRLLQAIPSRTKRRIVRNFLDLFAPFYSKVVELDGIAFHLPLAQYSRYVLQEHEPGTRRIMQSNIRPGMVVVDVGANIGYFSLLMARLVGPQGKVYAVEPSGNNLAYLQKNTQLNRATNVEILPYAAGDRSGQRNFYVDRVGSLSSFYGRTETLETSQVEEAPLDELIKGHVDFAKIDVEGGEIEVLKGMERILQSNPDLRLIVEWNPATLRRAGYPPEVLPEFLLAAGFTLSVIDDKTTAGRSVDETMALLRTSHLNKSWYANLYAIRNTNVG